jgi:hypothetical protein
MKSLFSLFKKKEDEFPKGGLKQFLKEIEPLIRAKIKNIPHEEWRKFSKTPLIALFHI